ncbi:MAG: hypothetical protein MR316_07985 [Lachnospiraceae bacterium]|nr:hypothetical protein [Lachnospiraceae bacterium]
MTIFACSEDENGNFIPGFLEQNDAMIYAAIALEFFGQTGTERHKGRISFSL